MKPRRAVALVLLLLAAGRASAANTVPLRAADKPQPAPRIELADPHGKPRLLEARDGAVTLVHFWATWCGPCREELPALQALPERVGACDLEVLAVAADGQKDVRKFAAQHGVHLPILVDQYGEAMHALGVRAFPETLVADARGIIRLGARGMVDWQADDTLAQLEALCDVDGKPANTALR